MKIELLSAKAKHNNKKECMGSGGTKTFLTADSGRGLGRDKMASSQPAFKSLSGNPRSPITQHHLKQWIPWQIFIEHTSLWNVLTSSPSGWQRKCLHPIGPEKHLTNTPPGPALKKKKLQPFSSLFKLQISYEALA